MKILVACEFSDRVRSAFEKRGHDAWSCDLLPSGNINNDKHFQLDVLDVLNDGWDMMIAFPPCTYLTVTANRSFYNNPDRWQKRVDALNFVWKLMHAPIEKICIENPKGVIVSHIKLPEFGKPQYIHPCQFGHPETKQTGLWLKNLPLLNPTDIVEPEYVMDKTRGRRYSKTHFNNPSSKNKENAKLRSITYQGIADAMASQWG